MPIKKGDNVKMEYIGTFEDGTIFDGTDKNNEPIQFEVGAGKIIKGLEDAVIGMEKDEEKTIKLKPQKAYGRSKPELIKVIPKDQLTNKEELKPGMLFMVTLPNGIEMPGIILKVEDETATVDLNHPLAGKTISYKIKIVEISS